MYSPNNSNAQKWYIITNGDGYSLVPKCSITSALDVTGAVFEAGTNIEEWTIKTNNAQRVFIKQTVAIQPDLIELSESELSIEVGGTRTLIAQVEPQEADQTVIWSSDNENIITVDDNGIVTAVSAGTAWVSARTSNGLMTRCEITVTDPVPQPSYIALDSSFRYMNIGDSFSLYATVYPEEADQTVIWYSDDNEVASVDENGKVTATGEGYTLIRALSYDGSVSTDCSIWVEPTPVYYTVIFDVNGHGTAPESQTVIEDGGVVYPTSPTATGWTFGGWYTDQACTKEYLFENAVYSDLTLYAKWTQNSYTVTFNANGHGTAPTKQTIKSGGKVTKPADPTASDWTFGGWYTDQACTKEYNFSSVVSSSFTLYAKWSQLATPVIAEIENTSSGVKLTWGEVTGAEKYRVFIKNGSKWKKLGDTTSTSYTHTGAVNGTKYIYTIRCTSSDGSVFTSAYNSTGWTITYYSYSTPQITKLSNTVSGVSITWGKVTGAAKYRVFVKNGSKWKKLGDTANTSWTNKSVVSGTTYTYTVRCISSDGTTFTSTYDTNGQSITYLAAPTVTSVTKVSGGVKIKWNTVEGAVKYRVFRKIGTGGWKKLGDTTNTSWTNKSVVSGTTYTYTVRCISDDGSTFTSAYTSGKAITY